MGEIAAAIIFHQTAEGAREPVFEEAFMHIGRDEGRCMNKLVMPPLAIGLATMRSLRSMSTV